MLKQIVLAVSLLMASSGVVYASCFYDGQQYPEGAVIGPYICSGGQWVSQ